MVPYRIGAFIPVGRRLVSCRDIDVMIRMLIITSIFPYRNYSHFASYYSYATINKHQLR